MATFAESHAKTNSFVCQSIFHSILVSSISVCLCLCVCEAGKELRIRRVGSSGGLWNKGCQVVVANDLERLQKCHRSSKVAKEMESEKGKSRGIKAQREIGEGI